ncbi:MAG: 2-oxo acid dehydrogenase subunit E2 [Phycisphaerales bacterium]|nr:2-oxo acid dehydrogenase subunit E2 [Phycisphaerales bacterium]
MAHAKSTDPDIFILPDLGEGVHEAELIKWRVEVGQAVQEHEILAEMETDKALVEVPSPRAGVIAKLHGSEGEILHVGKPLVTYQGSGPAGGGTQAKPDNGSTGHKNAPQRITEPAEPAAEREDAGTVVGNMSGAAAGVAAQPGKALATPAVRRLARDLGVDIDSIGGTGIGGRVTESDVRSATGGGPRGTPAKGRGDVAPVDVEEPRSSLVEAMPARGRAGSLHSQIGELAPKAPAARPAAKTGPAFAEGKDTLRIPFRGVRRTIANRLRESVDQAVHFNVMDEADVSALDGLRKKLAAASGEKVSFLPFVASAVCRVLTEAQFRGMNATVDEKAGDEAYESAIIQHRAVHLGIATDTDAGLMVPVIRDCDALGVLEVSRQIAAIANAARSRSIPREQLTGSTFTISNVGSHAGRFATPIINYPEVGILAVGRGRQAPVIRQTSGGPAFAIGLMLPLSLACDHRVVDGATAALALARIVELLQDPEQLLGPARG